MSDLERGWEARFAAQQSTIDVLRRENRMLHEIGNKAIAALVDAIHTTAATGPLAAVTGVMEWLVDQEMDVDWDQLDGDWLSKWRVESTAEDHRPAEQIATEDHDLPQPGSPTADLLVDEHRG